MNATRTTPHLDLTTEQIIEVSTDSVILKPKVHSIFGFTPHSMVEPLIAIPSCEPGKSENRIWIVSAKPNTGKKTTLIKFIPHMELRYLSAVTFFRGTYNRGYARTVLGMYRVIKHLKDGKAELPLIQIAWLAGRKDTSIRDYLNLDNIDESLYPFADASLDKPTESSLSIGDVCTMHIIPKEHQLATWNAVRHFTDGRRRSRIIKAIATDLMGVVMKIGVGVTYTPPNIIFPEQDAIRELITKVK